MESALSEIEFLALSANRVSVLRLLATGPQTRSELAEATGASQATLGRILTDFEARSWCRTEDGAYVATATGRLVSDGFTDLLDILDIEGDLRGIVRYLPTDAMDFDLRHLADAQITVPSQVRPNAPVQRLLELLRGADDVRAFSHAFNEQSLSVVEDGVANDGQTFSGVFSRSAIDALTDDPQLRRRFQSLLEADGVRVRVRDKEIPLAVSMADDVVHLLVRDQNGVLQASVDTDDDTVRAWATDTFERYWEAATPLDADELSS
jgi:predicted transcriptional regulator